jgi:outer membrane protein OmpA-like peptidoglycan-associated protein
LRAAAALVAVVVVLSGCTAIKSRLPQRKPDVKVTPVVVAPTKPGPAKPPPKAAATTLRGFLVLAPASYERDRGRVRQALGRADADALLAGDVGYYLDTLQGRLRQVAGPGGRVGKRARGLALDASTIVRFVPAGPELGPGAADALAPIARLLGEYDRLLLAVRVNPDDGSAAAARLAQERAAAVADVLAKAGIPRKRIVLFGTTAGPPGAGARVEVVLEPIVRAD